MAKLASAVDILFKITLAVIAAYTSYEFARQKQQNDDIKLVTEMIFSDKPSQAIAGYALAAFYQKSGRLPLDLFASLSAGGSVTPNPQVRDVANAGAAQAAQASPAVRRDLTQAIELLPARVYFHIRQEADRAAAAALETRLEQRGAAIPDRAVIVPGIQLLGQGPGASELRCFRPAECAGDGKLILDFFARAGVAMALKDLSAAYQDSTSIRRNHFEVWFAPGGPAAR